MCFVNDLFARIKSEQVVYPDRQDYRTLNMPLAVVMLRTCKLMTDLTVTKKNKRCDWAGETSLAYVKYHDKEWGVPVWDDRTQFEFLILEGASSACRS